MGLCDETSSATPHNAIRPSHVSIFSSQVMRLVLALMCQPLFQRNVDFDPTASRWSRLFRPATEVLYRCYRCSTQRCGRRGGGVVFVVGLLWLL